jgi:hypothetical protein
MNLTRNQLIKVLEQNNYIMVRYGDGQLCGINCRILNIALKRHNAEVTRVKGYYPISFQEYISNKTPFY